MYLSICLSIWKEAIKRGVFQKCKLASPKRAISTTRLLQKIKVLSPQIKKICETTSLHFRTWQLQERSNLTRPPRKWKVEQRADGLIPICFVIFPSKFSKVLRLPGRNWGESYEVLRLSREIILANLKVWCAPKCSHSQEISTLTQEVSALTS
jgi:hypothetical protein